MQPEQPTLESLQIQLGVLRAMLAIAYREREKLQQHVTQIEHQNCRLHADMHKQRMAMRTWLIRTIQPPITDN